MVNKTKFKFLPNTNTNKNIESSVIITFISTLSIRYFSLSLKTNKTRNAILVKFTKFLYKEFLGSKNILNNNLSKQKNCPRLILHTIYLNNSNGEISIS